MNPLHNRFLRFSILIFVVLAQARLLYPCKGGCVSCDNFVRRRRGRNFLAGIAAFTGSYKIGKITQANLGAYSSHILRKGLEQHRQMTYNLPES